MLKFILSVLLLAPISINAETASHNNETRFIQYKPHAPVSMTFSLPEQIKVNEEFTVQVTFKNDIDVDDIIIRFHTNNNLKLISERQYSLGIQASSQSNTFSVIVIPKSVGLFYINVSATLVNNGNHQSRSFAIPVKAENGDAENPLKANGIQKKSSAGGGIISMPAVERPK